jgi:AcrR family transcriptional regulator
MPRPRMKRIEREAQILEVAYDTFARRGFDDVSMSAIAERAGITKPILYAHFGSKDGLFAACVKRLNEPMLRQVRAAVDPSDGPDQQLWAGILEQLRFIENHRAEWNVFVTGAVARGGVAGRALARERERVIDLLADLVEQATQSGPGPVPVRDEAVAFAFMLQGIVERIADWWEQHPGEPVETVALRAMNLAWRGFGELAEGRAWFPPPQG